MKRKTEIHPDISWADREDDSDITVHFSVSPLQTKTEIILTSAEPIEQDDSDITIQVVSKENPSDGFYVNSENFRKINPYSIAFTVPGTYLHVTLSHENNKILTSDTSITYNECLRI